MIDGSVKCMVCPHGCELKEGMTGRCRARSNKDGQIVSVNYGVVTSLALDPIEKKPLNRFNQGSRILSVGSFGCNLNCPFCQNHEIAAAGADDFIKPQEEDNYLAPDELTQIAINTVPQGNIGVAFTYNEPLVGYEYVLDTSVLLKAAGLKTVLVTNGCVNAGIADKILPYTDALNIDLKCFDEKVYRDTLGGDLETVRNFIEMAVNLCHVELTTLIVPGMNDSPEEMLKISEWIASLKGGEEIPLHVTRFFPRHRMTDRRPTDVELILNLADVAGRCLKYVYPGNI